MSAKEYPIPSQLTRLDGCKEAEPLTYTVKLSLVELFVQGNSLTGLPLKVWIRPTTNSTPALREWFVPFQFVLQPELVRKHRKKLKNGNPFMLSITTGSFATGIEQWLREALFPHLSLRILFFPKGYMLGKEDRWRIEVCFCGDVVGQWNGEHAGNDRHPLFIGTGPPV